MPTHRATRIVLLKCLLCTAISASWAAASRGDETEPVGWPSWRGPAGQGHAARAQLPERWPSGELRPEWDVKIGDGWSSPVVADGRVFITDRIAGDERLAAFDATTGKSLWTVAWPVEFDPHPVGSQHGNGPKATAVVAGDKIYALGIAGRLRCHDVRDGRLDWEVNFPAAFGAVEPLASGRSEVIGEDYVLVPVAPGRGAPAPLFGYTGSLAVDGDLVISSVGGALGGTIMAFDRHTGKERWRSLKENVSYSSPIVCELAGERQVVVMTGPRVVGLRVEDGALLWSYPFQIQYDESIGTPVASRDKVLFTATGRPLTALAIARQGNKFTAERSWTNDDLSSYLSSMAIVDDHVFGMNDGGEICCLSLADGERRWIGGQHGFYSTPVAADGQLLFLNERGALLAVRANSTGYLPVGDVAVAPRATWTSPAIVSDQLYIRYDGGLRCFSLGQLAKSPK